MRRTLVIAALAVAAAAGCSDKSMPAVPTPSLNVTGTWAGPVTILDTATRMTWTLTQANSSVTGPVLLSLPAGTVLMNGFLTGALNGTSLTYTISVGPGGIPTQPTCAGQIAGTMTVITAAPSTMSGPTTVTGSTCTPPLPSGTLTLTKQ
jgi:hypothetical protein